MKISSGAVKSLEACCRDAARCFRRCAGLVAVTMTFAAPPLLFADAVDRKADTEFLRQLTERGFFQLAEQHCRRLLAESINADEQARWQLQLSKTYQQHAWFAAAADRVGLLNQSVEEVSRFLNDSPSSLRWNLQLRLQLSDMLQQSVRMNLLLTEAGHLFRRHDSRNQEEQSGHQQLAAHTETLNRSLKLTDSVLNHLDAARKDIDVQHGRQLRDEARLLQNEAHAFLWRISSDVDKGQRNLLEQVSDDLAGLTRSAASNRLQCQATWMQAELALYTASSDEFQLKVRRLASMRCPTDYMPELLSIRDLLFRGEVTKAASLCSSAAATTSMQRQELLWLKLESVVASRELSSQLQDQQLIQTVQQQFETVSAAAVTQTAGVFRDAVERAIQRYHLVEEVGVEIADLIEQIEAARLKGDNAAALRLIDLTLGRLPSTANVRSRAALQLRAGQILLDQQKWPSAFERLGDATERFGAAMMTSEQAASDLLRIFAMSQMLANKNAELNVSTESYVSALKTHLAHFSREATADKAAQWLQKAIGNSEPLLAAEFTLQQWNAAEISPDRLLQLFTAGEWILNAAADNKRRQKLEASFRQAVESIRGINAQHWPQLAGAVELQLLYLDIVRASVDSNWTTFRDRFSKLQQTMPQDAAAEQDPQMTEQLTYRQTVVEAVVTARTTADTTALKDVRTRLIQVHDKQLMTAIQAIDLCYHTGSLQQGDSWLATVNATLLSRLHSQWTSKQSISSPGQVTELTARASFVSGQPQLLADFLESLTNRSLSSSEWNSVAAGLAKGWPAQNASASGSAQLTEQRIHFWNRIKANHSQGSDTWLEASLQIAVVTAAQGDSEKARRQLEVISVLYPDWGNPERLAQAKALQARLK